MSDYWIVSAYRYAQQPSFEVAEKELSRLQAKFPQKNFRIYRCKTRLQRSGNYPEILAALQVMAEAFQFGIDDQTGRQEDAMAHALGQARAAIAKATGGANV